MPDRIDVITIIVKTILINLFPGWFRQTDDGWREENYRLSYSELA